MFRVGEIQAGAIRNILKDYPIKHVRSLNVLDGTPESPQDHCHKMRRPLMSTQECKIAWCTPNQLEMKPISPSLAP